MLGKVWNWNIEFLDDKLLRLYQSAVNQHRSAQSRQPEGTNG
jgi:hypothetical protein